MRVYLLTDMEQSTEKWEKYHNIMGAAFERHDSILKEIEELSSLVAKSDLQDLLKIILVDLKNSRA